MGYACWCELEVNIFLVHEVFEESGGFVAEALKAGS